MTRKSSSHSDLQPRLKVAVFLQDLAGGGAERVMANLAQGLADEGHAVDLVLVRAEGPFLQTVREPVRVVTLNCGRVMRSVGPLRRYIDAERPDAVVSALVHVNVAAILARGLSSHKPVLLTTEHTDVALDRLHTQEAPVRLAYRLMPVAYRFADGVFGVSAGVADSVARAARLHRTRVGVLYNPVLRSDLSTQAAQSTGHAWIDNRSHPVFLAIGRLVPPKNFSLLLDAFAVLRRTMPCRLIILGEGPLRQQLEEQIRRLGLEDSVALPGFLDNPYPWIRGCDVFVQSSRWEGLPTVLIEALALDKRIVATDCPHGPSEILQQGALGALVPVADVAALASGMREALSSPASDAARPERADAFSLRSATSAYIDAIRLAMQSRTGSPA